jgi:hypothetical protein
LISEPEWPKRQTPLDQSCPQMEQIYAKNTWLSFHKKKSRRRAISKTFAGVFFHHFISHTSTEFTILFTHVLVRILTMQMSWGIIFSWTVLKPEGESHPESPIRIPC